jgi:hypothetical protein
MIWPSVNYNSQKRHLLAGPGAALGSAAASSDPGNNLELPGGTWPNLQPRLGVALAYYHGHRSEIDADIEADERFVADRKAKTGSSKLQEKLATFHGTDDSLSPR